MWRWKQKRNRRSRKHTLLNVKLPIQKVKQRRARVIFKVVGFVFGFAAIFLGVWFGGRWLIQEGFYQNKQFSIRTIDIRTDGIIDPTQIHRWACVKKGDNLFQLDLLRMKRDLEIVPLIEVAAVDRVLPDILRIRVTERKPVAQVIVYKQNTEGNLERRNLLVDKLGFMTEFVESKNAEKKWLPVLMGVNQADLIPGRTIESTQVLAALQLISRFDLSPMAGLAHMRFIDTASRETMEVRTWQGATVRLSLFGLDRQLTRWRQIHDLGRKHNRAITRVDLSIKNNLPVLWMPVPLNASGPSG